MPLFPRYTVDLKSLFILTLHVPCHLFSHLRFHSFIHSIAYSVPHPVAHLWTSHVLSARHCTEAWETDVSMEQYKYCVLRSVPRRGLYTINVGTEQGGINSPWKVGTVFKETSEETCLQNQAPRARLLWRADSQHGLAAVLGMILSDPREALSPARNPSTGGTSHNGITNPRPTQTYLFWS